MGLETLSFDILRSTFGILSPGPPYCPPKLCTMFSKYQMKGESESFKEELASSQRRDDIIDICFDIIFENLLKYPNPNHDFLTNTEVKIPLQKLLQKVWLLFDLSHIEQICSSLKKKMKFVYPMNSD